MQFTKLPENAFKQMQFNAGVICTGFTPNTGAVTGILGATTGGLDFKAKPNYIDRGEDVDNCPKNTKELMEIDYWEVTIGGTFVTISEEIVKKTLGSATIASGKITPKNHLVADDFSDVWWVGDYSDNNTGNNAGYVAIHIINSLSEDGFNIKSEDKKKGKIAFTLKGHYSMTDIDTPPFEIYVKSSTAAVQS